jgi:hypothetical protein
MKTDWTKLITEHHASAHADGTYELVLGSPASAEELDKTEKQLGIHFPKEFRTLYQTHNGFGFSNKGGAISWSFMPLEQLPRFINRVRFYIEDDFPDEAAKFFPFFNWHDGGGTGYLLNEKGKLERRIYDFHPEQISKSYREMGGVLLEPGDKSIRQFLSLR